MTAQGEVERDKEKEYGFIEIRINGDEVIRIPIEDASLKEGGVAVAEFVENRINVSIGEAKNRAALITFKDGVRTFATVSEEHLPALDTENIEGIPLHFLPILRLLCMIRANKSEVLDLGNIKILPLATPVNKLSWGYVIDLDRKELEVIQYINIPGFEDNACIYWTQSFIHADANWIRRIDRTVDHGNHPKTCEEVGNVYFERVKKAWEESRECGAHKTIMSVYLPTRKITESSSPTSGRSEADV